MSFQKISLSALALVLASVFSLAGCGTSAIKQRKEQRDKMLSSSKLYCEFVNGDVYVNDIDVALNIEMSKRCDIDKPFTVSPYKTPSESQGLIYCCSMSAKAARKEAAPKDSSKKEDAKKSETEEVIE